MKHRIDETKIEKAIEKFETDLDFELIPVIADKSSSTESIKWLISLFVIVVLLGSIDWIFNTLLSDSWISKTPFYIATPFVAFVIGLVLERSNRLRRWLIPARERRQQVYNRAELFFYRKRWHELKSHNALMLYISVMERQIVIYHDPRLEFKNRDELTQKTLKLLQSSFKSGQFEQGLLSAIENLQQGLKSHFSRQIPQAENNVPNKLIWLDD